MMAEDGGNPSEDQRVREAEGRSSLPRTFIRLNDLSGGGERSEVETVGPGAKESGAAAEEGSSSGGQALPYPSLAPVVFFYLKQTTRPRSWCLKMVCNPYPFMLKMSFPTWKANTRTPLRTPGKVGQISCFLLSLSGLSHIVRLCLTRDSICISYIWSRLITAYFSQTCTRKASLDNKNSVTPGFCLLSI
ncbi:hypothetical protein COCON_G00027330 [Conger conger]|uniref:Uncharacterized protein n=1 Tax=Conger conger TaxID=82655 RepID=A0A9Q1DY02_CONCO|nr:hypothetical protein COCON_G00027330 [Conger conger]